MKDFVKRIKEYYPLYISQHQNKWNRRCHFVGQLFTLAFLVKILLNFGTLWFLLPFVPFVIYPMAWFGHLYFEKNKPATWSVSPLLTKVCDWVMFSDLISGRLEF